MKPKDKDENAKDPRWKIPVDLPGALPDDYIATQGPADQDGTDGFAPQLSGNGKAGKTHTSSFDMGPPDYTIPGYPSASETAKRKH